MKVKGNLNNKKGAVLVWFALLIVVLLGFAALALDIGHLVLVRNELQNAADAGALAGAQVLYTYSGTSLSINTSANTTAQNIAKDHLSDLKIVDVNSADVQRGHWCFSCTNASGGKGEFTPNPSTAVIDLVGKTTQDLDIDTNFINAVRVYARRSDTPASSFFAKILGYQNFVMSADAVAYLGFSGQLNPLEADQPIAICNSAITNSSGAYRCSVGKMMTNGSDTAAWTNFTQPCQTATPGTIGPNICIGNPGTLTLGAGMGTNNGNVYAQQQVVNPLINCWSAATGKVVPWELVLPVIDCPSSIGPCTDLVGAVKVNVLFIKDQGNDPNYLEVPTQMLDPWKGGTWSCSGTDKAQRIACWDSFVNRFELEMSPGVRATAANGGYIQKTIYFKPSCEDATPKGLTGGQNFGVLAKIPVLVK